MSDVGRPRKAVGPERIAQGRGQRLDVRRGRRMHASMTINTAVVSSRMGRPLYRRVQRRAWA
jgi:hypothetical protein